MLRVTTADLGLIAGEGSTYREEALRAVYASEHLFNATPAAFQAQNQAVLLPDPQWYYAMIESIEPEYDDNGLPDGTAYLADCVLASYFEEKAPAINAIYPMEPDRPLYPDLRSPNRKLNTLHRKVVGDFLADSGRFLLVRWLGDVERFHPLKLHRWYLLGIDVSSQGGVAAQMLTHAQVIRPKQPPQPSPAGLRWLFDLSDAPLTTRLLKRVISLDFVPDINFGGNGMDPADPPLNPVILPSGTLSGTQLLQSSNTQGVVATRIDPPLNSPSMLATKHGQRVIVKFQRAGKESKKRKRSDPDESENQPATSAGELKKVKLTPESDIEPQTAADQRSFTYTSTSTAKPTATSMDVESTFKQNQPTSSNPKRLRVLGEQNTNMA